MLNLDNNAYKTQKEPLFLLILVKNYSNQFKSIPVIILMNWVIKYGLSWQLSLYQIVLLWLSGTGSVSIDTLRMTRH